MRRPGFGGPPPPGALAWDEVLAAGRPDPLPSPQHGGRQMIYTSGTSGAPKGALRPGADPAVGLALVTGVTNTFTAPTPMKQVLALPGEVLAAADLSSMRSLVVNAAPVPSTSTTGATT